MCLYIFTIHIIIIINLFFLQFLTKKVDWPIRTHNWIVQIKFKKRLNSLTGSPMIFQKTEAKLGCKFGGKMQKLIYTIDNTLYTYY